MIISSKYKFTFLKNPKTGGTAVHDVLDGLDTTNFERNYSIKVREQSGKLLSSFNNQYYGFTQIELLGVKYYNLQFFIDNNAIPGDVEEYSNYVVVRDPIDRYMSFCRHVRKYSYLISFFFEKEFNSISVEENCTFKKIGEIDKQTKKFFSLSKQFIDKYYSISLQEIAERVIDFPFNKIERFDMLRMPQNYYYNDPRVTAIDYANLQEEIYKICQKHNTRKTYTIPKIHTGIRLNSDLLSLDLINKIKQIYAEDIDFYAKLTSR